MGENQIKIGKPKPSRSVRRFEKKVNAKMAELVNAWFKDRAKFINPDGEEAVEALNRYNNLWKAYCNKIFKEPSKFVGEFLDICDREDKRIRAEVEKIKTAYTEWDKISLELQEKGMSAEQIANEFDKFAKEKNIQQVSK